MVAASLESFHPRKSNRPADQDRVTRREASHFIIAVTAKEDGSEKERRGQRKGLKMLRPPGLPFIAQTMRYERL
jgi:hypothetical protein